MSTPTIADLQSEVAHQQDVLARVRRARVILSRDGEMSRSLRQIERRADHRLACAKIRLRRAMGSRWTGWNMPGDTREAPASTVAPRL